eukprot:COSAG06_NODE_9604_length_1860_cov_2.565020_1_plen_88_part_10
MVGLYMFDYLTVRETKHRLFGRGLVLFLVRVSIICQDRLGTGIRHKWEIDREEERFFRRLMRRSHQSSWSCSSRLRSPCCTAAQRMMS